MISNRWQRRGLKNSPEDLEPGFTARAGNSIRAFVTSVLFESLGPGSVRLPVERPDNGPFGRVGPNTAAAVKGGVGAVGRTVASPFGALVTVTVADEFIRVLTARGNRVRAWTESELPPGVVQDGLIVDEQTFIEALSEALGKITRNGKLNGQKVAVAITGRNLVQRRLTVYVADDEDFAAAIVNASSESMSIRTEEMQLEWDAEELDLIEEEDEEPDDGGGEANDGVDAEHGPPVPAPPTGPENPAAPMPETPGEIGFDKLDLELEPEPEGEPYDVYALALHKHVIRRNLRTVSDFGARFAGVQPKILALAAAVNSRGGVILDIESNTLITAVVSNGLPEVIREVGIDPQMTREQWVNLVKTQVSRAVAFYDSIFPEQPLGPKVEVFVTGQTERISDAVNEAIKTLPFVRSRLPQTLRAPEEFSFDKYAANVGLVIVSGKRFWQRAPVPLLPTPRFDYRPLQYRPRPLPVRSVLKISIAVVLSLGILGLYRATTDQSVSSVIAQSRLGSLERQMDARSKKVIETSDARNVLEEAQNRAERLIAANDLIQDRSSGFAGTMTVIADLTPQEVDLTVVDDDGEVVMVEAEAADYPALLSFIQLLEEVPQFERVQILNLGQASAENTSQNAEPGIGPAFLPGIGPPPQEAEEVVSEPRVRMAVEISRIEIDDKSSVTDEELATAGGQGTGPNK